MTNYKRVDQLLQESATTGVNSTARPALLALTRATTNLIYQDLVATQYTDQPTAALYGVQYLTPGKALSFSTGATYSGAYGLADREALPEFDGTNNFVKGDVFVFEDVVFKVLKDDPFAGTTETDPEAIVQEGIITSAIRLAPEAAPTVKFESGEEVIDAKFKVDKWQAKVKSRKLKTSLTVELAQDMEANGFNTTEMLDDILSTQMAEEINKDILQSLITVSSRYKVEGVTDKGILDLSSITSSVEAGRNLYHYVCDMNAYIQRTTSYAGTYVVGSARAIAALSASGWLLTDEDQPDAASGVLRNGLVVYTDTNSPIDYVTVGVKAEYGDEEMIGSLFYAPYAEGLSEIADPVDHVGAYKIITDPDSLQPTLMLLLRYALCVNPYTMPIDDKSARVIDSTDLDQFAAQSKMSVLLGLKLPKHIEV